MQLVLKPEIKYYNTVFRATMQKLEAVSKGTRSKLQGADLMTIFGGKDDRDGTVGMAYIGTTCWKGREFARVSISEWRGKGNAGRGRICIHCQGGTEGAKNYLKIEIYKTFHNDNS